MIYRALASSGLVFVAACGGLADGGDSPRDPESPSAPSEASPPSNPGSRPGAQPGPSVEPSLPSETVFVDHTTAPLRTLEQPNDAIKSRCDARIGQGIPFLQTQAAWETRADGHRVLGTGTLLGSHYFNEVLGYLDGRLFVQTWGGSDEYGVVAISTAGGAVEEIVPLQSALWFGRGATKHGDALYLADDRTGTRLLRLDTTGAQTLTTLPAGHWGVKSTSSGLYLLSGSQLLRWSDNTLSTVALADGPITDFDVSPEGKVIYAVGNELRITGREQPVVQSTTPILSVRLDRTDGYVVFTTKRDAPMLSSFYRLGPAGVTHVVDSRRWQSQGTEQPLLALEARGDEVLLRSTCSNDEDGPGDMPIRFHVAAASVEYIVELPSYPYVREWLAMSPLPSNWDESTNAPEDGTLRIYTRR